MNRKAPGKLGALLNQDGDLEMVKKTEEADPKSESEGAPVAEVQVAEVQVAEEVTYFRVTVDNVHTSKGKFERGDVLPIEISASEIRLLGDKVEVV